MRVHPSIHLPTPLPITPRTPHLQPPLTLPVTTIFVLSSERLYSDLSRKYAPRPGTSPSDAISIIRLDKSGGCVDRDESYMKALRHAQIRAYFFGHTSDAALAPHSQSAAFDELAVYRVRDGE